MDGNHASPPQPAPTPVRLNRNRVWPLMASASHGARATAEDAAAPPKRRSCSCVVRNHAKSTSDTRIVLHGEVHLNVRTS